MWPVFALTQTIITKLNTLLDAAVSTRAPASTALSTSIWTSTRAGKLDSITANPSVIKRVQRIGMDLQSAETAAGEALDYPVVEAKSIFLVLGSEVAGGTPTISNTLANVGWNTSGTELYISRHTSGCTLFVEVMVVEFY